MIILDLLKAFWTWVLSHSPREIAVAVAVLLLGLFFVYEVHHQRNIGYDECQADHAKAMASAQKTADTHAVTANAAVQKAHDDAAAKIPDYLLAYNDTSHVPDCGAVPYVRKLGGRK